ncbi:MAG: hypothetical protein LBL36_07645, partial [Clostridiales Family XIII bacterium]|nr:hypothetical protein [Clostridiales Family XIII bacterium]
MKNIMRENFRRLWPVMLVWTLLDLIGGPVLAALSGSPRENMFGTYTLGNGDSLTLIINIAFTVVTGVALLRYAHSAKALSVVHALPVRRRTQFIANSVSGFIMITVPQVITALCLLPFTKLSLAHLFTARLDLAKIDPLYDNDGNITNAAYHTDAGDILRFLLIALVTMFFIYALTLLAGVITGSTAVHLLVACFINVVVPALYYMVVYLCGVFLHGYAGVFSYGESIGASPSGWSF